MKTIFTTFIFAFCSFFLFAQEDINSLVLNDQTTLDSVLAAESSQNTISPKTKDLIKTHYFQHSKKAVTQLRLFLAQNTIYPKIMVKNNIEGTAVLEVIISGKGEIESASVFRGVNSELDKASINALKLLKNIDLKESRYYGNKTIYVPVVFSITDI